MDIEDILQADEASKNTQQPTNTAGPSYAMYWGDAEVIPSARPADSAQTNTGTTTTAAAEKPGTGPEATTGTDEPAPDQPASPKVSAEIVNSSARTAVAALEMFSTLLFKPLINWQFNKKLAQHMAPEEITEAQHMAMGAYQPATEDQHKVAAKFNHWLKQRDAKIQGLEFDESETEDLENAFKHYMKEKNKTMPPEYFLGLAIASTIGARAVDSFMWQ